LREKILKASKAYDEAVKSWRVVEEKASMEEHKMSVFAERLSDYNISIKK
jgi:hypothetical protein